MCPLTEVSAHLRFRNGLFNRIPPVSRQPHRNFEPLAWGRPPSNVMACSTNVYRWSDILAHQITAPLNHHGADPSGAAVGLEPGIHKPAALPHPPTIAPEHPASPAVTLATSWWVGGAEKAWCRHQRHFGLPSGAEARPSTAPLGGKQLCWEHFLTRQEFPLAWLRLGGKTSIASAKDNNGMFCLFGLFFYLLHAARICSPYFLFHNPTPRVKSSLSLSHQRQLVPSASLPRLFQVSRGLKEARGRWMR
ncbi:hypothetical protein B0J12DRAFT_366917 [Macrophomina phaseolina]|uniref:Uncharacterized protein n=1 Tax=Macrophomina phaseolina TaxID=35725 RepID=A0ABQ8FTE6_9PEZI|nr:hypothetical protein B0J12DRAFT_366917 [Macrophomina phaseolina]